MKTLKLHCIFLQYGKAGKTNLYVVSTQMPTNIEIR